MASSDRVLDIVLLGATGYTGTICAEHIVKTFPTSLRWAIAGRSLEALENLSDNLRLLNLDRVHPDIEVIELHEDDLNRLARKAMVFINAIGPYHRFSSPILQACAYNGTHYVDFTTETLWIKDMIHKCHSAAVKSGAMIIPASSLSSSPSDLVAWLIATTLKDRNVPVPYEVICSSKLNLSAMSKGSFTTLLDVRTTYGSSWFLFGNSSILSSNPSSSPPTQPWIPRLLPYCSIPHLGILTTSFIAPGNASIVHRSASLNPALYGPNFTYREYLPVPTLIHALTIHILTTLGNLLLSIPPIRQILRFLLSPSTAGPDRGQSSQIESAEFKAVGLAGGDGIVHATARLSYTGSLYELSAVLVVEAAGVLLDRGSDAREKGVGVGGGEWGGGILTPSSLGMPLVRRLRENGIEIIVEV